MAGGDVAVAAALPRALVPSIRLRAANTAGARSRIAGIPFAPPGFDWPRRASGRPLAFLAQVDLRELPRSPTRDVLPPDGVLAFFYDVEMQPWGYEERDADACRVLWWPDSAELVATQPPAELEHVQLAPQQGLVAACEESGSHYDSGLDIDAVHALYERAPVDLPLMRMLGEPDAIQSDPREEADRGDWLLLLQLDSEEPLGVDFGDCGRIYFLVSARAMAARRFDAVHLVLQCY